MGGDLAASFWGTEKMYWTKFPNDHL